MPGRLTDIIKPAKDNIVLIYDVQADQSGALAILNDFYDQVKSFEDKTIEWVFVLSTPVLIETPNIKVIRYPWTKKSWLHRLWFETITTKRIINRIKPDIVLSLQNKGINCFKGRQLVYLHMAVYLTDHKFSWKKDGMRLWLYQNVISRLIVRSLLHVNTVIVQTEWMKDALISRIGLKSDNIIVQQPMIASEYVGTFEEKEQNYRRFFYPAFALSYKNHWTLLRGLKLACDRGLSNYELILTLSESENKLANSLAKYAKDNGLNVFFCGKMSRSEVFALYTRSVLVFPSYLESFGLPLLEAKLTGAPIIAADTAFAREILGIYKKASFFPEMDEETLSEFFLSVGGMINSQK